MAENIPTLEQNPGGLHQRYIVTKASGDTCDPGAVYFVLRLDSNGSDKHHIEACRQSAFAYCDYVTSGAAPHLALIGVQLRALLRNLDRRDWGMEQPQ